MKPFTEQGLTYEDAETKAWAKYARNGERLIIMKHEDITIPGGFLNLFSKKGVKISGVISSRTQYRPGEMSHIKPAAARETATAAPNEGNAALNEEKEKFLAMAHAGKENAAIKEVLVAVKSINEKLEHQGLTFSREEHHTLNQIDDILIRNDFPASYRKALLEQARNEIPPVGLDDYNAAQDQVLEWIGESIKIYANDKFNVRPRIMILVGPTGVGKTTTIAKLAANFGIDDKANQKRRVALVTIDTYRVGAKQQLEKYAEVMDVPCYSTSDYNEMKKIIAMNSECVDLFLVDTIGRNPRDMIQLGEMKKLLSACGTLAEIHLVVAATTKSSDLREILQHFEAFDYRSVLITKMDETIRCGNVIGALAEKGKSISYVTNGQKVPTDIRKASVVQFLINLEGFRVNRMKLEEKFPDKGQEQMQKWR